MDQLLKQEMQQLQSDLKDVKGKMDKMYFALMGNEIAQDGGLVRRIIILEEENETLKEKIEALEKKDSKTEFYVKTMWTLVGAFGTGIFGYVLHLIFNK